MGPLWQNLLVLAAIAVAGVYLGRALWNTLRARRAGCGACSGGCVSPTNDAGSQTLGPQVISIQPLAAPAKDRSA